MPLPFTGHVWDDRDSDTIFGPDDIPLAGVQVRVTGNNGFDRTANTDSSGLYTINTTGVVGIADYIIQANISDEWTPLLDNPQHRNESEGGGTFNFPFTQLCFRPVSSWVIKVCFIPARGIRVTYRNKSGGLFSCIYPGTSLSDYATIRSAASKGRHMRAFYYKQRPYLPWVPTP